MYKIREFKEKNYKGIYFNGKTIRITLDSSKPILDLDFPEFYDIKLTNHCTGGCKYCYQSSVDEDSHYEAVNTLNAFFGRLTNNQKPFQIAYGGGEPTSHPKFREIMELTRKHGIAPNYTTNGMWVTDFVKAIEVLSVTKQNCEGVAVTCHPHLKKYWEEAVSLYLENGVFTNFHNLISDAKSVDEFVEIYVKYTGKVKYFVVLPLLAEGRAKGEEVNKNFDYFFSTIKSLRDAGYDTKDIAFGANFYPYIQNKPWLQLSIYEPEIMSKYIDLGNKMVYKSSFDTGEPLKSMEDIK